MAAQNGLICAACAKVSLVFFDEINRLDNNLALVAHLLRGNDEDRDLMDDVLPRVGEFLAQFLERRLLLEHIVFGRSVEGAIFDTGLLESETLRVMRKIGRDSPPKSDDADP